jgi:hypothetical protein
MEYPRFMGDGGNGFSLIKSARRRSVPDRLARSSCGASNFAFCETALCLPDNQVLPGRLYNRIAYLIQGGKSLRLPNHAISAMTDPPNMFPELTPVFNAVPHRRSQPANLVAYDTPSVRGVSR